MIRTFPIAAAAAVAAASVAVLPATAAAQDAPAADTPVYFEQPVAATETAPPAAEEVPLAPRVVKDDKAILSVQVENDVFTGTDRHYTNGFRLAYLSPEDHVPQWLENAARALPLFADEGNVRVSYAIGQSMYTPKDIEIEAPQPDDHPWAGFTYGTIGIINDSGRRLDSLELTLGVIGPASQADDTQEFVHDLIDTRDPAGWDNQLHNEPIVNLAYERAWRAMWQSRYVGLQADVTPHAGGAVGNAFIYGNGGLMFRIGQDLPSDYGPPRIRPSLPGSDFFVPHETFGWYLFAGVDGRLVLRDIFLDGNTFRDSASVHKKWLVGEIQAGLAVTIDGVRLAYTHVYRTERFEGQDSGDTFGAFSVSFRF